MWELTTLQPYFIFEDFIVHTDQSSLRWLINVIDPSGHLNLWRLRLSEFRFVVRYKKGILNFQADALLRLPTNGGTVLDAGKDDIPWISLSIESTHEKLESKTTKKGDELVNEPEGDYYHLDEILAPRPPEEPLT